MRTLTALLAAIVCLAAQGADEAPTQLPQADPWGKAVGGLQCRLLQIHRPVDLQTPWRLAIQFRNASQNDLALDITRLHEMPVTLATGLGDSFELRPVKELRCDLRLPDGPMLCRLGPGEVGTFTRPLKFQYRGGGWRMDYYALYNWRGQRALSLSDGKNSRMLRWKQKRRLPTPIKGCTARFAYERPRTEDPRAAGSGPAVWTGRIETEPIAISFRSPRLGPTESRMLRKRDVGDPVAQLACGLEPLEERVALGKPCLFRLTLWNHSRPPRQYRPVVNLLAPGGLTVKDQNGRQLRCRSSERKDAAGVPLRALAGSGRVVLSEFDLAAAYDLTKPGTYRVQFPGAGGDEEAEVVLPASNTAEVQIVASPEAAIAPLLADPPRVLLKGSVKDPDGQPASGAKVALWPTGHGVHVLTVPDKPETQPGAKTGRTGGQGQFRFADVEPGGYGVLATHPKLGTAVGGIGFAIRPEDSYELTLTTGEIRGVILGKDRKTPLAGIRVSASRSGRLGPHRDPTEIIQSATSDEQGRFRFIGLRPGEYRLSARLSDDIRDCVDSRATVANGPAEIELSAPACTLKGKVVTPDGVAVRGAQVSLRRAGTHTVAGSKYGQTDVKGEFSFTDIAEGDYKISVYGPRRDAMGKGRASADHAEVRVSFTREEPDQRVEVKLAAKEELMPGRALLTVLDQDGEPLKNRRIACAIKGEERPTRSSGRTNGEGVVELKVPVDRKLEMGLVVGDPNAWAKVTAEPPKGEKPLRLTVTLQPCGFASGRIVEEGTGRGLGGFSVHPRRVGRSLNEPFLTSRTLRSDPVPSYITRDGDGSFRVGGLVPGEYEIWDRRHDPVAERMQDYRVGFEVFAGKETEGVELTLPTEGQPITVHGRALDAAGKPVPNKAIMITPKDHMASLDSWPRHAVTDDEGRFALYPMQLGFYHLQACVPGEKPGPAVRKELKPGRARHEIVFPLAVAAQPAPTKPPPMPPPTPAGTWGKPRNGLRTRVTPVKPKVPQYDPVIVRVEMQNVSKWPKHYDTQGMNRSFRGKRPDGKPMRNIHSPYQTGGGLGPMIAPNEIKVIGEVNLADEFDVSRLGKYQVQYYAGYWEKSPPPSNTVEFEVVPRDPKAPLPPVSTTLPLGIVEAIEKVLPKNWVFGGVSRFAADTTEGYGEPLPIWIRYGKTLTRAEAARTGGEALRLHLILYDRRLKGPGLEPVAEMRLLGETDWYRVYAEGKPDPKLGWQDPDADIIRALKLRKTETGNRR